MGPAPVPLIPNWDVLARTDGTRRIEFDPVLESNWLQMMETNVDPTHNHFLHHYTAIKLDLGYRGDFSIPIKEIEFEFGEFGILKRSLMGAKPPRPERWEENGVALFPNILRHSGAHGLIDLHYRVPIDDTHSQTIWLGFDPSADGSDVEQTEIPITINELKDENGEFLMINNGSQDSMAWETQGPIRDRTIERLGAGDRGVMLFRELLRKQIEAVQNGDEPIGVVRDPERNRIIPFGSDKERLSETPRGAAVRQVLSGNA
jgi:5,5'-dehydrodivanillate O-demethylase